MTHLSRDKLPINPRLIFMGTPEFAVPTLKALIDQGHHILTVVTQPDRPKGRGKKIAAPPVKRLALEHGIEVLQPERASDKQFISMIREKGPDLIIVVALGQILKKELLYLPKWGVINIHASLLPRYRGAAPIQWAILNNESWTGLTIMRMDEGLDTGPILLQKAMPILRDETAGQLHDRLALEAGDMIIKSLNSMAEDPIRDMQQDHARATYAPKLERDISLIDWRQPAHKISALIRALDPWPGACTLYKGKELKLFSSSIVKEGPSATVPGRIVSVEGALHIEAENGVVEVRELQYPGKKRLAASEFLRGFPLPEGAILGA